MKKSVKALIVAASVAAVVGVGAVSFAAWAGSGNEAITKTGSTGEIATLGAMTVTPATNSLKDETTLKNLFPVDQTNGMPADGVRYWEFKLESEVTGSQNVTYSLAGTLAAETKGAAELYWSTGTAPTTSTGAVEANKLSATATTLTGVANGGTVYVYMVASGTDAMNTVISLTFSAAEAAAA